MDKKRYLLIALIVLANFLMFSQNLKVKNWVEVLDKDLTHITVTPKIQKFKIDKFVFESTWDSKQNFSNNIGFYGGIKTLKIYKDNKLLNTISKIEDAIALGEIYFEFYDYNFDGYIDFSVPIDSGKGVSRKFYLYNKELNQFKYYKDWDYVRIDEINKSEKQIRSIVPYNANHGTIYRYQVTGYTLKLLETNEY